MDRRLRSCVAHLMAHRWLIGVSVGAHLAVGVGLFATGVWRIDRLEPGRFARGIAVMTPPRLEEGGPKPGKKPEDEPKKDKDKTKRKPAVITQPEEVKAADAAATSSSEETGKEGPGTGTGSSTGSCTDCAGTAPAIPECGNRAVEVGEQCDDGNTLDGDGCSSTCRTEVKRIEPVTVAPTVLRGLRMSGDTDVHPSTATQNQMLRDGTREVDGRVLVCVAIDGSVASTTLKHPTGYPDYDGALLTAIRAWRYRPYTVGNTAVPACGMVTFHYVMR